jgi:hypothetical protein
VTKAPTLELRTDPSVTLRVAPDAVQLGADVDRSPSMVDSGRPQIVDNFADNR